MNILFIRPAPSNETIGLQHVMIVEPLELEVLASLKDEGDCATIVDLILDKKPFVYYLMLYKPDVLCITGYITHIPVIIEYCTIAKIHFPKIITITGGVHCEVCPEHLDNSVIDYRVIRNATRAFPLLLKHLKGHTALPAGVLRSGEPSPKDVLPEFDFFFPFPNRSLTEKYRKNYFYIFHNKVALIKTAFGCPQKCTFCFCRKITDDTFGTRPVADVVNELLQIKEKEIYIVDDDFLASKQRLEIFLDTIERFALKKSYLIYGRADFIAKNSELIRRFKQNGLRTVIVGLESFFDDELNSYNKNSSSEFNKKALEVLCRNGIDCFATVIVPPSWDRKHFRRAGDILRELKIQYVNLQPLTPLPGTELFNGRTDLLIQPSEFEKWDLAHVSISPEHMTVSEFYREILNLYNRILFRPSILFKYLISYNPCQLIRMLSGTVKVKLQYENKIREARKAEGKRYA